MKNRYFIILTLSFFLINLLSIRSLGQDNNALARKVVDEKGNSIPYAEIRCEIAQKVITADENGNFSIKITPDEVLLVEAEGFESRILDITALATGESIVLSRSPYHMGEKDLINVPFGKMTKRQMVAPVSSLDVSELVKTDSRQSVKELIRGRIPGLYGSGSIRGLDNALIVVDGFPRASLSRGSDFEVLNYLHIEDIDQITFLKDASASQLYGVEAANGVIQITTKRGKTNKSRVGARAEWGIEAPVSYPNFLGGADYMKMYNQASVNDGGEEVYSQNVIENTRNGVDPIRYPDEDFFNSTYLKDNSKSHQLSAFASGGNRQAQYYSKVGWTHSGSLYALEQEGKSFTTNDLVFMGNVDYQVNDWLRSNLDIYSLFGFNRQPVSNFWSDAATQLPNAYPVLIPVSLIQDETIGKKAKVFDDHILGGTNQYKNNIYGNFVLGGYNTSISRISQINTGLDFNLGKITEGLSAKAQFNYDILNGYFIGYNHTYAVYEPTYVPGGNGDSLVINKIGLDQPTQSQSLSNPNGERRLGFFTSFNYERTFNEKHLVTAIASGYLSKYDLMGADFSSKHNNFGTTVNYMYDNRYILQLSGILTGSGYLPEDDRYRMAPSLGLGWIVSDEAFLSESKMVNYLKLKASYGRILTDDGFPSYRIYYSTFSSGGNFNYNQGLNRNTARVFSNLGNPKIDLLSRNDLNVGFESLLFNRHLSLEANYFKSVLDGVIVTRPDAYPSFIPYLQSENYEKYSDEGVEFGLNYQQSIGSLNFDLGGNMAYVVPKAVRVEEPDYKDAPYRQLQGNHYDAIFGYEAMGLFQDNTEIENHPSQAALGAVIPGDIKYKNLNDDDVIDQNDQKIIGNSRPRLFYGLQLTLNYKKLSLFAMGYGQGGSHTIFKNDYYWQVGQTVKYSEIALNSWTETTASTATYPILHLNSADNNFRNSTYWLEKNNWFKLHTMQLSYLVKPKFAKEMQFFLRGSNLATFSPIKEKLELNIGSAPQMRTLSVGCNLVF